MLWIYWQMLRVLSLMRGIGYKTPTEFDKNKNYLEKVTVLSTNRDLEENVKKGANMLAIDIEKIPFYQDGLKKGIEKGKYETL